MIKKIIFLVCILNAQHGYSQQLPPYKNPDSPVEQRVQDLLGRMNRDEKFHQLFLVCGDLEKDSASYKSGIFGIQPLRENNLRKYSQGYYGSTELLKRINHMQHFFMEKTTLAIPMMPVEESLHGLTIGDATSFPVPIAMASSFDTVLMKEVVNAIALETKATGIHMVLSPVLNLATDVRWGRVEETYGEDPYLASAMGLQYVKTMEENGIITTPKHFVVNHGEGGRDSYPIFQNERILHETYFKPFEVAVKKGHAHSMMMAYNSFDGRPCSANSYLMNDILRKRWGFHGFTISDAGGTGGANVLHFTAKNYEEAGKQAVEHGLDVIFQTDIHHDALFKKPFLNQGVSDSVLNAAVGHVLKAKFEMGLFDHPYLSDSLLKSLNKEKHQQLAYQMALESAVLLRNKNQLLPISEQFKKIAVIGEEAVAGRLGGYSGTPNHVITILEGLQKECKNKATLRYLPGCSRANNRFKPIPKEVLFHYDTLESKPGKELKPGLLGSYYGLVDHNLPLHPTTERTDNEINFDWSLYGPDSLLPDDHYKVEWQGILMPNKSGNYQIGIEGNDDYVLEIREEEGSDKVYTIDREWEQGYHKSVMTIPLVYGKQYILHIRYSERSGHSKFKLIWDEGISDQEESHIQQAVQLVKEQDMAIIVAGIEDGEFQDRSLLQLPGRQEEMIQRIAATGKPIVVLLIGGAAITMNPWLEKVGAVVMLWYPGEMGGQAIAELLTGKENFSGKLPITFPQNEGQLPLVYNHFPTGRGDDYVDGSGQALFPFGYGLSYVHPDEIRFDQLELKNGVFREGDTVEVSCYVTNHNLNRSVDEVVQLYLRDELASVVRPVKELKGFQRIHLYPGERKPVKFKLYPEDFQFLNEDMKEVVEPGVIRLMIGLSSKDIRIRSTLECR